VHAPTKDKCDDSKDSFYVELEQVFDQIPKHHMIILLRDFIFSNQDLQMRVNIKPGMIMGLQ
jgi:hypothetical protein